MPAARRLLGSASRCVEIRKIIPLALSPAVFHGHAPPVHISGFDIACPRGDAMENPEEMRHAITPVSIDQCHLRVR